MQGEMNEKIAGPHHLRSRRLDWFPIMQLTGHHHRGVGEVVVICRAIGGDDVDSKFCLVFPLQAAEGGLPVNLR